jgi:hypothetical protein
MKINDFFKSAFKGAVAIFIAVIALSIVVWGYSALRDAWEKREAKKYEAIKLWSVDLQEYLQFNLTAKTKLADGRLFAIVEIRGYPSYLSDPRLETKNNNSAISLLFQDDDGFKLHDKTIKISEFSSIMDAMNKKSGLRYEFNEYLSSETYSQIKQLKVAWTLETALPATASPTPPTDKQLLDHCAPNLSKSERLKRLAQHGTLRQSGEGNYSVGYRSLHFFTQDGSLLGCQ